MAEEPKGTADVTLDDVSVAGVTEMGIPDKVVCASLPPLGILISAIRLRHWIKNLFLLAPLLFAEQFFNGDLLLKSALAFMSFCFIASSVYLLNDILDYKHDREHPVKMLRPIASGQLRISYAIYLASFFLLIGATIAVIVSPSFTLAALGYLALNILYSTYLKHHVIVDVLALSLFYVIRVVAGGLAVSVHLSSWLLICTFLLALFMGFGKRRHELTLLKDNAKNHRAILSEYSPYFLDQMIAVVTSSTLIAYSLYTMNQETIEKFHTDKLPLTIPFVLYGIFRYLYLVHQKEEGGNPTQLILIDKPLILTVAGWIAAVLIILYIK